MANTLPTVVFTAQVTAIVVLVGQRIADPPPACIETGPCEQLIPYYESLAERYADEHLTARIETCMQYATIAARTGSQEWRERAAQTCLVYDHPIPEDPCDRLDWQSWIPEDDFVSRRNALSEALFVAHCPHARGPSATIP